MPQPLRPAQLLPPLVLTAVVAALLVTGGSNTRSAIRHLYLVPALWSAFEMGLAGGGLVGLMAGLLQAPVALAAVEHSGLTSAAIDGLVALVAPLVIGGLVGRLVDQARARDARLAIVLEIQRALRREGPLAAVLQDAAETIRIMLSVDALGLVIGSCETELVAATSPSEATFHDASAAAFALRSGRPVVVRDVHTDSRLAPIGPPAAAPRRALVLPLPAVPAPVGVLAIERSGDMPSAIRTAAEELALHLAVAVENARLTLRQRRFAEELEAKVHAATARLRELDRAKSEFLSVVAHELRTPLTALQGFSELLLSRSLAPERASRFLGHVHSEALRLGRLVTDLLDLSRIEAGRELELRREEVDLGSIIERNVEMFAAEHRGHDFERTVPFPAPRLRGDPDAVDRILKNLLSNAVKYSPRGGKIAVAAELSADRAGMLALIVQDDGVGISAEDQARIFDRYVRIPSQETATVRGLGLGLCLVRALAESHGGAVEVESAPGKGSRFRVLLPL